jgi:hypothetical protein
MGMELHDEDNAPILLDTAVAQDVACGIDAATKRMPVGDMGQGPCNAVLEIDHTQQQGSSLAFLHPNHQQEAPAASASASAAASVEESVLKRMPKLTDSQNRHVQKIGDGHWGHHLPHQQIELNSCDEMGRSVRIEPLLQHPHGQLRAQTEMEMVMVMEMEMKMPTHCLEALPHFAFRLKMRANP